MTKPQLRKMMKAKRNALHDAVQEKQNKAIYRQLFQMDAYNQYNELFIYVSFQSEIATDLIIKKAIRDRKKVFVPRVEHQEIEFYEIHSFDHLVVGSYGIREPIPTENTRFTQSKNSNQPNLKLMILPGLAFDPYGNRVGYGAGFYDRYLDRFPEGAFLNVALAYDFQVIHRIKEEAHDTKIDMIITPTRMIDCSKNKHPYLLS